MPSDYGVSIVPNSTFHQTATSTEHSDKYAASQVRLPSGVSLIDVIPDVFLSPFSGLFSARFL
jgi:hypothetical protein